MYVWKKIQEEGLLKDGVKIYGQENIVNVLIVELIKLNMVVMDYVENVFKKVLLIWFLLKNIGILTNGKNKKRFMIYGLDLKQLGIMEKVKLNVIVVEKKIIDFFHLTISMVEEINIYYQLKDIVLVNG